MLFRNVRNLTPQSLLKPNKKKGGGSLDEPLIVFTFDDAFTTDYTFAYPLLTSNGFKGTSYVATSWVGGDRFCTWEQLKEMYNSGQWDLQCHTHTHPMMGWQDEERLRYEIETVNDTFVAQGLPIPKHHAYPYGDTSELSIDVLNEYRLTQRLTGAYRNHTNSRDNLINDEFGLVKGVSIDTQSEDRLQLVKDVIQWGYNTRKVIVVYCHQIVPEPTDYAYQISEHYLTEIVNFVKSLGIRSVTISEMYDEVYNS